MKMPCDTIKDLKAQNDDLREALEEVNEKLPQLIASMIQCTYDVNAGLHELKEVGEHSAKLQKGYDKMRALKILERGLEEREASLVQREQELDARETQIEADEEHVEAEKQALYESAEDNAKSLRELKDQIEFWRMKTREVQRQSREVASTASLAPRPQPPLQPPRPPPSSAYSPQFPRGSPRPRYTEHPPSICQPQYILPPQYPQQQRY